MWKNFLTPSEAEKIVESMEPEAPWSREQWQNAIGQSVYPLEEWPCYNRCALWVTMNMIMSDSSATIDKYVDRENIFNVVHDLAVDKLCDKDEIFSIRKYFGV